MCDAQMKSILDTFRVGDDLPLESKAVSETLDKVQQQVEAYYYDIRQKVQIRACISSFDVVRQANSP
jgi:preprotein translocase subunit SecA